MFLLLGGLAVAMVGCNRGPATYPATGKVAFKDGAPLIEGFVSFRALDDEKHPTARGQIQPDGTFTLATIEPNDGAVLGRHQALIVPIARGNRVIPGEVLPPKPRRFDPRFSSYESSGLEFEVTDDASANNFDLVIE